MKLSTDEFTGKRFGKYEVLCRVAVGGMAEIFLGFAHAGSFAGRAVVLKRILAEQREDPQAMQMLIDEAKLTATLTHPNVAQVLDLEVAGEDVLLVIEFIQGANFEEIVEAFEQTKELVPVGFVLSAVRDAAQGLANAHSHKDARGQPQPIIHRDVTPRNLMVNSEGVTKVLDFGIARAMGSQRRTVAGMVRGTTAYMSPEQAIGKELDPRTDIFSLGTIFHELLTGQRLFHKGNPAQEMAAVYEQEIPLPSKVNRRVPKAIDAVVMKALERKREARYQSPIDLMRELSLAAGSSAWPRERMVETIRERFARRLADIDKLLGRVPQRVRPAPAAGAEVPPYPEGRTVVTPLRPSQSPLPPAPAALEGTDAEMRTVISGKPLGSAGPVPTAMPPQPTTTDTSPQVSQPSPSLSAEQLFGDLTDEEGSAERTRIIPGGRPNVADLPTNPKRTRVRAQGSGSRVLVMIAVVLALVLGAGVGALLVSRMQSHGQGIGRLSVTTDRPADVVLGGQVLGKTPLDNVFVPSGHLTLELREEDGTRRAVEVDVVVNTPARLELALDTLHKVP